MEEGGLVDTGVLKDGGVSADETAPFGMWATLGEDDCRRKRGRLEFLIERVLRHERRDDLVDVVLLSFFARGNRAELVLRKSIK